MATTPLQALPVPSLTDPPNGPSQFLTFGSATEKLLNMTFTTSAARDAAIGSPVAGMVCYLSTPKRWYYYDGSAWILSGGSLPRCFLTGGAISALATGVTGQVLFPTEKYDTDALHDTTTNTNRITIPTGLGGVWRFGYSVDFVAFGAGDRQAWMLVNNAGQTYARTVVGYSSATLNVWSSGMSDIVLVPGDYVALNVNQSSGSPMNIGAAGGTVLWGTYVGPS
jgi:hypothetical protein